jgi:hypothetical protein
MAVAVSQEYPLLNQVAPSWADIKTVININGGISFRDIDYKEIKWKSSVDVGEQRGASGGRVMKHTTGVLTDEGSAVYYKSGLRKLITAIQSVAPVRGNQRLISLVTFDIIIQHTPPGDDDIYHEEMRGCSIKSLESSMVEGPDAETVALDLRPKSNVWVLADGTEVVLL